MRAHFYLVISHVKGANDNISLRMPFRLCWAGNAIEHYVTSFPRPCLTACIYYEDPEDEIKPITKGHTAEYYITDTTYLISRFLLTTQQTKQLPLMSTIMSMVSAVVKATSDDMTEGWQYYWATEVTVSENWKKKLPIFFCAPLWIRFTQKPKILWAPFHIISWWRLVCSIINSWYTHRNKFLATTIYFPCLRREQESSDDHN